MQAKLICCGGGGWKKGAVTTRNCVSKTENKTRRMRNFAQQQNSPQNICKYLADT